MILFKVVLEKHESFVTDNLMSVSELDKKVAMKRMNFVDLSIFD